MILPTIPAITSAAAADSRLLTKDFNVCSKAIWLAIVVSCLNALDPSRPTKDVSWTTAGRLYPQTAGTKTQNSNQEQNNDLSKNKMPDY